MNVRNSTFCLGGLGSSLGQFTLNGIGKSGNDLWDILHNSTEG